MMHAKFLRAHRDFRTAYDAATASVAGPPTILREHLKALCDAGERLEQAEQQLLTHDPDWHDAWARVRISDEEINELIGAS
ncbi:hypothetical protein [Belnapia sp. F-4-1]|uniref:hypothetical protein n=1 Tax=Belnapia sp. F-4-1 TaxID=1545443 RepID=UPI0005B77392|nr:hypothetical protein [Belnapia sp. F-4-1]